MGERLDKFLASQGLGTRKEMGKLIRSGAVLVNGAPQRDPGAKVEPGADQVTAQGEEIRYQEFLTIMLNKPAGVLSATEDRRQKTVLDLLPEGLRRRGLFPAGRLDKDTTGLLLITDDGELAHKMLSPKSHVYKQYRGPAGRPRGGGRHPGLCRWRRLGGGAVRPRPPVGGAGPPSRLCGDPGRAVSTRSSGCSRPGARRCCQLKTAQDRGPLAGQYTTGRGVQASYPRGNPGNFPLASCTKIKRMIWILVKAYKGPKKSLGKSRLSPWGIYLLYFNQSKWRPAY